MDKLAAYEMLLEDHPLWTKEGSLFAEDKYVDSAYGKVHDTDHSFLADHAPWDTDDPHETRARIIQGVLAAKKPEYRPGLLPNFRREAKQRMHEQDLASWERTRDPEYLKRVASDFAANGEAGVF